MFEHPPLLRLCVLLLLVPRALPAQASPPDALVLRPGDAVRLELEGEPGLNGQFMVAGDGQLLLPLVGFVVAGGVPFPDLVAEVRKAYEKELTEPSVVLTPVLRIAVLGEVRQPGLVPVDPTLSLAEVVASAGGLGPEANAADVRLHRQGETLWLSLEDGSAAMSTLRSGDQLVVGRRSWFSRNVPALLSAGASVTAAVLTALILR